MAKIRIISPHFTDSSSKIEADLDAYLGNLQQQGLDVSFRTLRVGPASIENEVDAALAVPGILEQVVQAEKDGVDAAIISCFGDPGLIAAREISNILVLGPGQTSMHVASLLGHRFSVISVVESVRPLIENIARQYGVHEQLASVRVIDIPVLDMLHDINLLNDALARQAILAVQQDKADVIVLGCTGFLGTAEAVTTQLKAAGVDVPVIDPAPTSIAIAQALVNLGFKHSERLYGFNASKPTKGYDVLFTSLRQPLSAVASF
jgi:allantoin racemase